MAGAHDEELEAFKTGIDLRVYAASLGYEFVKNESWRDSSVMGVTPPLVKNCTLRIEVGVAGPERPQLAVS